MKQWEDKFKERLEGYEMKLPSSDRDNFLNRKATRERYARRRRNILNVAVGIPAAAAILCAILLSIRLLEPSEPAIVYRGIDPSALGLPSTYKDSQIIYDLDANSQALKKLPVTAGQSSTGLIIRWQDNEKYEPFGGVNVDEIDCSGKVVNHTLTDENGYFSISIINPADSLLIHADGYEPMKLEFICLDGQTPCYILSVADDVYMVVTDPPEFPDGTQALQNYVKSHIEYPSDAPDGIKGRVIVDFIIEKDGSITNIEVLKSVHPLLDAEAIRVVSGMPRWTPGKHFGFPVRVKYTLPVRFN